MDFGSISRRRLAQLSLAAGFAATSGMASRAAASGIDPYRQAVAEAAAGDEALSGFYADRDYAPIWTSAADAARRGAFVTAVSEAGAHGLPQLRYAPDQIVAEFAGARTEGDRGRIEVGMSRMFLQYASDMATGVLTPSTIEKGMVREVPRRDRRQLLDAFAATPTPDAYLATLVPAAPDYARLLKVKFDLERLIESGGWGPQVKAKALKPGATGDEVVALRDRLVAMGYLERTATAEYDTAMQAAVQTFQDEHGLAADGTAGQGTIAEINVEPVERLRSVVVAMERLRWINFPLGERHIWVNEADFTAKVIDDDKVTFETRAIVGKNGGDTRSPEFSDQMEFMVVNPTWNVPRSIVTKEYLPLLQKNPNAVSYLKLIDSKGRAVSRDGMDFSQYTASNFPYALKQPPSDGNALGLVKFMFPNKYNIYLHDTPTKPLFKREVRAFSHGCIRLADPFDLAYTLLSRQTDDPRGTFKAALDSGRETIINLERPIPVHLVYFTAWPTPKGRMTYRRDIYGRDAAVYAALAKAGVVLSTVQG